jgi:hypothetical protein
LVQLVKTADFDSVDGGSNPSASAKRRNNMINQAMKRKIDDGEAIDLRHCARQGPYYILKEFVDDVDYCDGQKEQWIWSIGRRKKDGVILASPMADLYQNPEFECLWLR